MKITEREGNIITLLQVNGELGVEEIAKMTGIRPHLVRYCLDRLRTHYGIFHTPFLDFSPLGFQEYMVYLTISPDKFEMREQILAAVKKANLLKWIVALGGEFHFALGLVARDFHQVAAFLDTITHRFGDIFALKQVAMMVSYRHYGRRYLGESKFWGHPISIPSKARCDWFDELDHKILTEMKRGPFPGLNIIAKRVGAPLATVRYRERRLRECGIIAGYIFALSSVLPGTSSHRIFLFTKGPTKDFDDNFWTFCDQHPHVVLGARILGPWDYEIDVEVRTASDLNRILNDIQGHFVSGLHRYKCEPDMEFNVVSTYPFRDFSLLP